MRNPNLDYQHGLIDLWSVTAVHKASDGSEIRVVLGECTGPLRSAFTDDVFVAFEFKPSQSVMRFTGNDVAGIGEPK